MDDISRKTQNIAQRPRQFNIPDSGQQIASTNKKSASTIVLFFVIIIMVAAALFFFFNNNNNKKVSDSWSAIFVSNGHTYFGHIISETKSEIIMADIFYPANGIELQQGSENISQVSDISLVKFGKEVHGPKDQMRINKSFIIFIEELQEESKIVQAINQYKAKK